MVKNKQYRKGKTYEDLYGIKKAIEIKKKILLLLVCMFMVSFGSAAITTTLNSPADLSTSYTFDVDFNCSAIVTGGATLTNMSLWNNISGSWGINGTQSVPSIYSDSTQYQNTGTTHVLVKTYTTELNGFMMDNITAQLQRSTGEGYAQYTIYFLDSSSSSYTMTSTDSAGWYDKEIILSAGDKIKPIDYIELRMWADLAGRTIYIRNANFNGLTKTSLNESFQSNIIGTTLWNCQTCDSNGDCGFATSNYTLFLDSISPTITVQSPTELLNYGTIGQQETLNVTFTDTNLDYCWYNYNGTNISIEGCLTGVKNSTTFTLEENNYNMTIWANDSAGNTKSEFIEWEYKVLENSRTHNTTSYETARESYSINVTANSSLTSVSLNYNGTYYLATQSGTVWTYSMDIPLVSIGNNSIGWKFTYGGATINSDYETIQNVSAINLTYCTSGTPFINFTFKDEGDDSSINATIPTSTLNYYLGNGDVYKTLTYINTTAHYSYAFCFSPALPLKLDYRIQYQSENYPQRTSEPDTFIINGTTTNKILYLLNTVDGIYVTFQVINTADQLISGVLVTATREIGGEDVVVGTGITSASGSVTFWLNPDFQHDFSFSKIGYTTYEYSDFPTQTSYTITLSSTSTSYNSTFQGIIISIRPTDVYLVNDTEYTFAFNLTSDVYEVTDYGFNLRLANGTIFDGGSTGIEGTELTLNYNTTNQTVIYIDYYWLINGTYTNRTAKWIVFNTDNTGWSLSNFFDDLDAYLDSGIFGLDNFGRTLIIYLVLFISVGIMSFKYGFTSPMSITSMIFAIIYFMDVTTPIMPDITLMNGVVMENLPTFLAGLVLALVIFNEVRTR